MYLLHNANAENAQHFVHAPQWKSEEKKEKCIAHVSTQTIHD